MPTSAIAGAPTFPIGASENIDLVTLGAGAATVSGDTGFAVTDDVASELAPALLITTDNTDNDCGTVNWNNGTLQMAVLRRFGFYANFLHTEGSTNAANWFIGWSDVPGATFFSDTGTLASMDAIGIYKVETSMFFRTCGLNASTQSGETTTTAFASATRYAIECHGYVGSLGWQADFFVDRVRIGRIGATTPITITNMSKMLPIVAIGNGAGAAEPMTLFSFKPYAC